jgi:hypothetical protein
MSVNYRCDACGQGFEVLPYDPATRRPLQVEADCPKLALGGARPCPGRVRAVAAPERETEEEQR